MNTPAEQIVRALGGQWHGASGTARCPAHRDRVPSLSITDAAGEVLFRCHGGCPQKAVVSALWKRGLWPVKGACAAVSPHQAAIQGQTKLDVAEPSNGQFALRIWNPAVDVLGTIAERYLDHRGITLPVPPSLRFAPGLLHSPTGLRLPAIIAGVQTLQGAVSAIQRVFVRVDGLGKAAVAKPKLSLGPQGDGAVRLAPPAEVMGLCEGWETGLSALQLYGLPVWASLGASRMHRVRLPDLVRRVVIFADNDEAGRKAAERTAQVHRDLGRSVEIRLPADGIDFNDELLARGTMT
jgi:hypothetical protein